MWTWMYLTDANSPHPLFKINTLSDNTYDVGVMILPKKKTDVYGLSLLEEYHGVCARKLL